MSKKIDKKVVSDEVEFIHELVSILKDEGFSELKNSCPFCVNRTPKFEPRKCPVCNKLCYPKDYEISSSNTNKN